MSQQSVPSAKGHGAVVQDKALYCAVKVVIYADGMSAGLAIKATNAPRLGELLLSEEWKRWLHSSLHRQIAAQLRQQGVVRGIRKDDIVEAIARFIRNMRSGGETMVTARIAAGNPPVAGKPGRLEYLLNAGGRPVGDLDEESARRARRQAHRVRPNDVLVVCHPPVKGCPGLDVRDERVEAAGCDQEADLQAIAGLNTEVREQKLVARVNGLYRESAEGRVRVVQEVEMDEVSAATGDLPRSGIAEINALVRRSVVRGAQVQSTEDVFIGSQKTPGMLDACTRVRARHLLVRGQVAGEPLPEAFLSGELEMLEPADQQTLRRQLDRSQIQVEGLFAAWEVRNRNARAGRILVRTHAHGAALEAEGDIVVDGDLVGGVVSCGGRLQIGGDLGNEKGGSTRILLSGVDPAIAEKKRLLGALNKAREELTIYTRAREEHGRAMDERTHSNDYWLALLRGERRSPQRPVERQILGQFLKEVKKGDALERQLADSRRRIADLEQRLSATAERASALKDGVFIAVGGAIHPGVSVELVRRLEEADMELQVADRSGGQQTLQALRDCLSQDLNAYLELYRKSVAERQKILEDTFRGREKRPGIPRIPDRRFQLPLAFAPLQEPGSDEPFLPLEGAIFVHAHDPRSFYLRQVGKIRTPLRNMCIAVQKAGSVLTFQCLPLQRKLCPWQQDEKVLGELEEIWVLGQSARAHLLAEAAPAEPAPRKRRP